MKTMAHIDGSSIIGCTITMLSGLLALISKADIAVTVTILAALSTIVVNVNRFVKDRKK